MGVPAPDALVSLYVGISANLFLAIIFAFVWRRSEVAFFGLWGLAWVVQAVAVAFGAMYQTRGLPWLAPYATFEFLFAVLIVAGVRSGFRPEPQNWRAAFKILAGLPVFLALAYAVGWNSPSIGYHALRSLVLCSVFLYSLTLLPHTGTAARFFRFSLLLLAALFLQHGVFILFLASGSPARWPGYLEYNRVYDLALHLLLGFAAMAIWVEQQEERIRTVQSELATVQRETLLSMDVDRLTGLLNQSALARTLDNCPEFRGVVAVCDMDNFKLINDRYGHLVGDEILRNVGHLLRSSIRQEDEAFRWGGDEFVVLFHKQDRELAESRMQEIQNRLQTFQVRGHGVLPISFSWGTAESAGQPLRGVLEEADREMYVCKRRREGRHG